MTYSKRQDQAIKEQLLNSGQLTEKEAEELRKAQSTDSLGARLRKMIGTIKKKLKSEPKQ